MHARAPLQPGSAAEVFFDLRGAVVQARDAAAFPAAAARRLVSAESNRYHTVGNFREQPAADCVTEDQEYLVPYLEPKLLLVQAVVSLRASAGRLQIVGSVCCRPLAGEINCVASIAAAASCRGGRDAAVNEASLPRQCRRAGRAQQERRERLVAVGVADGVSRVNALWLADEPFVVVDAGAAVRRGRALCLTRGALGVQKAELAVRLVAGERAPSPAREAQVAQ